ncbi:MAG TPA: hypothetical protein VFC91_03860 [Atribacterota bacterium]|nr:hypothetical protein [Atribacterota bacterium]
MIERISSNQNFKSIIYILLSIFIIIFSTGVTVFATEIYSIEDKSLIPKNTIVLDEPSSQELVYISSDQSILLFRSSTPQLEQLQPGDVLWLNAAVNDNYGFLRQIIYISKKKESNDKGLIIKTIPWIENHPPFISALIAQPSTLEAGQHSYLTCHAADQDGDMLHYTWISSGGTILGNGPGITWIAPEQNGGYSISCEVMDNSGDKDIKLVQLFVAEKLPLLSNEEKELIRRFGWGGNKTIRWPDGYVEVYDATNFSKMQEVLDQWNEVLDGKVIFYLSNNPRSPVKVTYNSALRKENLCGHIDTHWQSYRLYAAEITINPDGSFCGYPENSFALYLHFFSGVAGFNAWKGEVVEKRDWQDFTLISEIMQMMIKALYQVSPGYDLNKDQ